MFSIFLSSFKCTNECCYKTYPNYKKRWCPKCVMCIDSYNDYLEQAIDKNYKIMQEQAKEIERLTKNRDECAVGVIEGAKENIELKKKLQAIEKGIEENINSVEYMMEDLRLGNIPIEKETIRILLNKWHECLQSKKGDIKSISTF